MNKPHNYKSKRPDLAKTLRDEPLFIPHSPGHLEEDSAFPSDKNLIPQLFLVGGTIIVLLLLAWLIGSILGGHQVEFPPLKALIR